MLARGEARVYRYHLGPVWLLMRWSSPSSYTVVLVRLTQFPFFCGADQAMALVLDCKSSRLLVMQQLYRHVCGMVLPVDYIALPARPHGHVT